MFMLICLFTFSDAGFGDLTGNMDTESSNGKEAMVLHLLYSSYLGIPVLKQTDSS